MFVSVCTFKRRKRSGWEHGIAVGVDEATIDVIIDAEGQTVRLMHDFVIQSLRGCFEVDLPKGEILKPGTAKESE